MGNSASNSRRYHHHRPAAAPQAPVTTSQYAFAAPSQYPNPNIPYHYHQYPPGYYPPPHVPFGPVPHNFHRYPCGVAPPMVSPPVEYQKAVTIRNDVNIRKDSIRVEEDDENPGKFLVAFTFDATAPGSITIGFLAKEGANCDVIATKPVKVSFEQGLDQKFRQPSGTGIDFSMVEDAELKKEGAEGVYPLMVKAEVCPSNNDELEANSSGNSQITLAVFDKKMNDKYIVRVMKQILWVNSTRYELQEIYGIGNSLEVESDENDSGKECVICFSEPRDTTVLPCRHMCMCGTCAKVLRLQTDRCPICRQPVERLLEIKVKEGSDE
ncbi:hypothetical protein P3X46_010044 [Hevea brasiliensis]|uniref:RING-type E3 ubiquitin transferase n=1 Tax=Hevea brasiliensis TaxID=3981 RepID=A0ABQ9MGP0_HEVBR|nr:probable E3 ubiquitin-protein ligase LOG2 [Hevea brasiliensis]KAJ9178135.1 hypothetical protein P3X46_010044 [Hevea brasiliensis]